VNDIGNVESDDFAHDVTLQISGDFADRERRMAYARGLAAKLNGAVPVQKHSQAARFRDWVADELHDLELQAREVGNLARAKGIADAIAFIRATEINEPLERGVAFDSVTWNEALFEMRRQLQDLRTEILPGNSAWGEGYQQGESDFADLAEQRLEKLRTQGPPKASSSLGVARKALEDIRDLIDGRADTEDVPDSNEVRPNVFMRIDQIIDGAL
jgi:hypothetical protein